jgi:hypothetical protein
MGSERRHHSGVSFGPILAAALAFILGRNALADAPPAPLGLRPSCSLNGRWCVESASQTAGDEREAAVRVFKCAAGKSVLAWIAPLEIRGRPTVTNDGACVIDFASGSNLIALDTRPSDPAFTVVCKGGVLHVLSIEKFIEDFTALPRTTSHRRWAESLGLDDHDRLVVRTVQGRAFAIDPHDGRLISGSWAH